MLGRLLALFLITPVVELALLIQLGDVIGTLPTIGIIVVTGLTGSLLAKREGLSAWRRFNDRLQQGELPGKELLDGLIILVAGALLITPGVLTDIAGFAGLIPLSRHYLRRYLNARIQRAVERGSVRMTFGGFQTFGTSATPHDSSSGDADRAPDRRETKGWGGKAADRPGYGEEES